ncbi:MAG: pentapeptide repeat-containing protein, partial [Candidatus Glassbacteria bacterium]|nr:pentapeptide repeat-containing protein [Candidatus Glassbacteria bacterium]
LEAAFIGANFHQKADFTGVNFQKEAVFKRAKFKQKSDFKWSEFRQLADFSRAKFEQDADFSRAKFQQEVEFSMVTFQQEADFRWAKFEGRVLFEGGIDNRCFHGPLLFNGVETGEKAKVIFNKVDLGRASFTDTDIENFTFRDVHWYRPKTGKLWLIREKALFDEFRHLHPEAGNEDEPPEEVDYSKLAENYSQLVLNHEKKRDFLSAHEFRIGEMEARRKDIGARAGPRWRKVREWLNAYALYGFLSNYGTSYWRALLVLALMLLAFAGLFFFSGFRPLSPEGAPLAAVSYDWSLDPGPLRQAIHDFWKAVLFALSVLTLQRGRFYVPAGELTQVWIFLAAIFFYSQVTLLLLAVRRRFKQ